MEKKKSYDLEKEVKRLKAASVGATGAAILVQNEKSRVEESEIDGVEDKIQNNSASTPEVIEKVDIAEGQVIVDSAEVEDLKAEIEDLKTQLASYEANTGKLQELLFFFRSIRNKCLL